MMNQTNSGFLNSIPPVTKNLIIINLLFWVASLALPKVGVDLVDLLGLHVPGATDFKAYQIVSYMFMHDTHSFAHVFFNMFAVYMFGRVLENVWGPKRFLIFYFVTGIGAGLVQEVVWFFNLRDVIFASQDMINLNGAQIISKVDAKKAVEAFVDTVSNELKEGGKVALLGFGSFSVSEKAARKGVNPKTKETIEIAARKAVKFKAGAELNELIK
jgi:nucleoid DNA-binding protein